jgi:hypothetical protein
MRQQNIGFSLFLNIFGVFKALFKAHSFHVFTHISDLIPITKQFKNSPHPFYLTMEVAEKVPK